MGVLYLALAVTNVCCKELGNSSQNLCIINEKKVQSVNKAGIKANLHKLNK